VKDIDRLWGLSEAARPSGFTPHARGTVNLLMLLEQAGFVSKPELRPTWYITDAGRAELARLLKDAP
jgi:hypothetical protein